MATLASHKIRARMKGAAAEVKLLIQHPMETGRRKDPVTGLLIPRNFIREIRCTHNGMEILSAEWSWGMARNPYLSYRVKDAKPGDNVSILWTDDKGLTESLETQVV